MSEHDEITRLRKLVEEKNKEIIYLSKVAKDVGNHYLRETEALSKTNAILKSKMDLINQQQSELKELNKKIEVISITDELTGLLNRRGLMMQAESIFSTYKHKNYSYKNLESEVLTFSFIVIDIDHFKKFNDQYGHLAGDLVLIELSKIIKNAGIFRETDVLGRYGGEEFVIILPECNIDEAVRPANQLFEKVRKSQVKLESGEKIRLTISAGMTQSQLEDIRFDDVFSRADQALYQAKASGRNRIEIIQQFPL